MTYSDYYSELAPLVLDPTFSHSHQPAPWSPPAPSAGVLRSSYPELGPPFSSKLTVITGQRESETQFHHSSQICQLFKGIL